MADDQPATDLAAAVVGYREQDGGPPEWRVDLIDPKRKTTVASLTPDEASATAVRLLEESLKARTRARLDGP